VKAIKKIIDALSIFNDYSRKIAGIIALTALSSMSVLYFLQVIFRYFFHLPLAWLEETCVIGLVWMARVGPVGLVKPDKFLKIDLFKFKPKLASIINFFISLGVVFILTILTVQSVKMTFVSWPQKLAITGWSRGIMFLAIFVGSFGMLFGFLERMLNDAIEIITYKKAQA